MKSLYSVKVIDKHSVKKYSYKYYRVINLEVLTSSLAFYYLPFEILQIKRIKRIQNKIYRIKEI